LVSHGREEHRLRVYKNRVLRRIFEPKRDEVTGRWRKLHNLYSPPNNNRMKRTGHVARMRNKKSGKRVLVGKPEGKRPLGRPRHI
jgi:hypothetical protein